MPVNFGELLTEATPVVTELVVETILVSTPETTVVVDSPETIVVSISDETTVVVDAAPTQIIYEGITLHTEVHHYDGSPPYTNASKEYEAGEIIIAGRAVYLGADQKIYHASHEVEGHGDRVIGVVVTGGDVGEFLRVHSLGELECTLWNWEPAKPLCLSVGGQLTQSPTDSGFFLDLGFAVTETKIFVTLSTPIY